LRPTKGFGKRKGKDHGPRTTDMGLGPWTRKKEKRREIPRKRYTEEKTKKNAMHVKMKNQISNDELRTQKTQTQKKGRTSID
jgi:hypothetical protein